MNKGQVDLSDKQGISRNQVILSLKYTCFSLSRGPVALGIADGHDSIHGNAVI